MTPRSTDPLIRVNGVHLRKARDRRGLSLRQLHRKTGKSWVDLQRLENGDLRVRQSILRRIARTLRVTPEYLAGESDFYPVEARLPGGTVTVNVTDGRPGMWAFDGPAGTPAAQLLITWLEMGRWRRLLLKDDGGGQRKGERVSDWVPVMTRALEMILGHGSDVVVDPAGVAALRAALADENDPRARPR